VVIAGQHRALAMAVKDWRHAERQTALAGLVAGTLRYAWHHEATAAPAEAS
jgi:hypothetical protein